ncbi:MAG: formylglycine-generating enzyme family protein [Victivallales bacterium]|nr:formylglycine-generating enzyme family protein [Victivallales bacterium]
MKRLLSLLCLLGIMFALQMKLLADPPLYMVVYDLDKTEWKVRYTNDDPDLTDDACRTTELWLRYIPAGKFMMGSPADEMGRDKTETQHEVTLTQPFYIGVFECTQKQWELVKGGTPSKYKGDCRPVETVSYDDIRGTGAEAGAGWPKYGHAVDETSFMGVLRAGTGQTFDLPTEAQWEYACRAGTTHALNSDEDLENAAKDAAMGDVGRYYYNESDGKGGYTSNHTKVGSYRPNNWGLYDMHGNVWECCLDWWDGSPYNTSSVEDPKGDRSGTGRVVRGGSWNYYARLCRSAIRSIFNPSYPSYVIGFRVLCLMPETYPEAYSVTVVDGMANKAKAFEGETVTITADEPAADEEFDKWVGDGVTFADATAEQTSFTMPAAAVTVTATYKAKPVAPQEYTVTVIDGVADKATAAKGDVVTITADDRFPSHKLLRWTTATSGVKFADKLSSETTFVMPAKDVTVKATYQVLPRYTVKVTNGTADKAQAYAGETVTITAAEPPANKQFYKWTCTGLTFENANVVQTTFVMPKKSVWVKANYTAK